MDLWKNHKPGDKESPSKLGPPAEDLWKNHKPGDKESPPASWGPPYRREYIPELYTERAGK